VDRIPKLHFDVFSFARYPHIRPAQPAQKIKGRLRLLAQGKPKRVLLASLPRGFLDVLGQPVKPVRRTGASDALVRSLVVVVGDPMGYPLACVRKGGKKGFLQELFPDRLPEPFDLAQGHRVPGCAPHMADPLPLQNLLEPCLATPSSKLAAVV
jgi:hypothetical protein